MVYKDGKTKERPTWNWKSFGGGVEIPKSLTVAGRGRCRISPPRFLAECCKRQLNQGSFLLYFRLSTFSDLY